jgi:N-acetylmuramoyl-L-alanine amidase
VVALEQHDQELAIRVVDGVGLLSWHELDNPPRVILELGTLRPTPTPAPTPSVERASSQPVVIDPGHGGDDTGAVSASGLSEKELTLDIARRLAKVLRGRGYAVRLTRVGDEARALTDRTAFANRLDARAFISLHANSSTVKAVRGAETYYMSLDRSATDAHAAATADLENQADTAAAERSPLDLILWDLAQSEVLNESASLALAVQNRLNTRLGLRDRGVKQAPFAVLTGATMPAVLVEVGFLSNPGEARMLRDPDHQQKIAEAVAEGVADFLRAP